MDAQRGTITIVIQALGKSTREMRDQYREGDERPPSEALTGVILLRTMTPVPMKKTQVYFRAEDLRALHRVAKERKRPVAELIREAVHEKWLARKGSDPRPGYALIGLYEGPVPEGFSSDDHDQAFDEP